MHFDLCLLVVEGTSLEDLLNDLPAANEVTNPDSHRGLADVPELISSCHWAGKVVISDQMVSCCFDIEAELLCYNLLIQDRSEDGENSKREDSHQNSLAQGRQASDVKHVKRNKNQTEIGRYVEGHLND